MKKLITLLYSAAILQILPVFAKDAYVLQHGTPITIALADDATPAEQSASEELAAYLARMTGVTCVRLRESQTTGQPSIYVGWTTHARNNGIDCATLGREEWLVRATGEHLVVTGGRPRGTLYAAYELLERLGVVWSDVNTEFVPLITRQQVDWNVRGAPTFENRCIWSGVRDNAKSLRFYARNRMNSQIAIPQELGGSELPGSPNHCHTFHYYTATNWPDAWFSLTKDGRRLRSTSGSGPGQICMTHPDARKQVSRQLREFIRRDREKASGPDNFPRIYDISHNDCTGQCFCPTCSAVLEREGAYSGVLLDFINHIAQDIARDYPEILIQTFAYTFTLTAPKHIKPADNVIMRVCKLGCEFGPEGKADTLFPNSHPRNQNFNDNFKQWRRISKNLAVWDYWILYTRPFHPPYLNARHLQEDLQFYAENKVNTLFVECESASSTSFYPFKVWFGLKMMCDPSLSYDELSSRFCHAQYGPAAPPMLTYMNMLQDRLQRADLSLSMVANYEIPYLDQTFFTTANALLDEAELLAADTPAAYTNVVRERVPVDIALLEWSRVNRGNEATTDVRSQTLEKLYDRYATNTMIQTDHFYDSDNYLKNTAVKRNTHARLIAQKAFLLGKALNLPEQFKDKSVIELNWSTVSTPHRRTRLISDQEATAGKAIVLRGRKDHFDDHKLPLTMGLYNRKSRKSIGSKSFGPDEIHQDGKYHLYHLGRYAIQPRTILWAHWSWVIQFYPDMACLPDTPNEFDVYVSLKLTGAPYQKGSEEMGAVFADRILLVR